jgi:hypothetical protein
MLLDAAQYDLCIAIKGIADSKLRDSYYKKMIDDKIRSQNIIRVIASLSMDPKSKQLQDTLKDLIISNQQIDIEIEEEMKKSNLSQQPEPTDQKILGNSIEVGTSSFKDKMQQMCAAPLKPDKVKEQTDERLQSMNII